MKAPTHRTWPLYVGGFLGPFGGAVVTTMLPEMAHDLNTSVAGAATSLTAYMVPFAACMLFSGTIAERVGRRRTVQAGYLVYTLASVFCALAPTLTTFLGARALQGMANAFTTPVLVAAISSMVPPERLGRSLGLFASMQATGQAMAPLLGGVAAELHWNWAFFGSAGVAAVLACFPPPDGDRSASNRGRWRSLANRQLALACLIAALAYLTSMGITLIGALLAQDRFDLNPAARGAVVAVYGVAGLLSGRLVGGLMDRHGRLLTGGLAHLVMGVGAAAIGVSPLLGLMIASIFFAGLAGTGTRTTAQTLAVTSAPNNRSGATSVMLACQFGGAAIAPLLWVPLYTGNGPLAMFVVAVPALLAGVVLLVLVRTPGAAALRG